MCIFLVQQPVHAQSMNETRQVALENKELPVSAPRFVFDSGLKFDYPDAVRGIYVTAPAAGGNKMNELIKYVDETDLNAMVIDIKDDFGNITYKTEDPDSPYAGIGKDYIKNPKAMLKKFEDKHIYPIARVVVFKDSLLAKEKPELSYLNGEKVWKNGRGEAFVNPFLKEVWDYNVGIAIEAAKMGFKEIQFDYVRFPEGFENKEDDLKYDMGEYDEAKVSHSAKRVQAVTDFVSYAKKQLEPYGVDVSVDIFGYAATLPEAPGIGQNFTKISENVDVISSMIYPSHWTSYFGIDKPDLEPYDLVKEYAKLENGKLKELKTPPTSRPWLQDFTASYLGEGNYQKYGKEEVEAQIKALNDNGIDEYLLWNAANRYTKGVDYTP
ncbi:MULTISPECIES: putative glycoside hydrolase [unclassified Peribacillus]|uniref:putative glycoside hydrolase n=1 Tax=unclassified Peribacillus TaxID=2675266 RepID=UPI001E65408B|nr:putative glycoside hydrolase [Peribacillus sp. Bi96]